MGDDGDRNITWTTPPLSVSYRYAMYAKHATATMHAQPRPEWGFPRSRNRVHGARRLRQCGIKSFFVPPDEGLCGGRGAAKSIHSKTKKQAAARKRRRVSLLKKKATARSSGRLGRYTTVRHNTCLRTQLRFQRTYIYLMGLAGDSELRLHRRVSFCLWPGRRGGPESYPCGAPETSEQRR